MRPIRMILLLALACLPLAAGAEAVVEDLHGFTVVDAHRHLETDEGAQAWIEKQHAATAAHFRKLPDAKAMASRLEALSRLGGATWPTAAGERTFFLKREGDEEQSILYVREGDGTTRALVDPAKLDAGGKVALDWYYPSPSGKLVAYGLSENGTENSVLHVLDVATGEQVHERIPNTRHASIAWLPDESGFYYTRYPEGERYDRHVYLHRFGDDPAKDAYVQGRQNDKTDWTMVRITPDGRRLFIEVSKGWSVTELWMLDREEGELRVVIPASLGALFESPTWIDDRIVVRTNHGAPNWKVVAIDPDDAEPDEWETLIPEGRWPMEAMERVGDRLAIARLEKAVSRLELYRLDGTPAGEAELPGMGAIASLDGEPDGDRILLTWGSFLVPQGVYEMKLTDAAVRPLVTVAAPDVKDFVVEQIEYPSYDGTKIPMFLVRRKGARPNGENPTLLTGYGGFNISLSPRFSYAALYWVERGGVYAVANLRGGAEYGEAWHEAGKLGNKHQVFRDFEYAMRHLVRTGWTRPAKLAITGGSNGGLLMGAMMTQAPELFAVSVGRVGLYDMIRFHRWPPAELWVDEYGSSDDPAQIGYLLGYSPYHQVLPGVAYPAFLGLTARADTRVTWVHTAKFVAALQEAQAGEAPILFHMEEKAGHGAGKGRSDRVKEEVMMFRFIEAQLGMNAGKAIPAPKRR